MNKESSIAAVSSLWLRHKDAANQYRKAFALAERSGIERWLEKLIAYREDLEQDCREMLETLPPVPVTPNKNITSALNGKWAQIKDALLMKNYSKLISICWEAEQIDYHALKKSLDIENLPKGIYYFLDNQGEKMLSMQRKVERMHTVPDFN